MADFGLVEKDVLCAIVTIIAGVDSGSRVFPFILHHIASKKKKRLRKIIFIGAEAGEEGRISAELLHFGRKLSGKADTLFLSNR